MIFINEQRLFKNLLNEDHLTKKLVTFEAWRCNKFLWKYIGEVCPKFGVFGPCLIFKGLQNFCKCCQLISVNEIRWFYWYEWINLKFNKIGTILTIFTKCIFLKITSVQIFSSKVMLGSWNLVWGYPYIVSKNLWNRFLTFFLKVCPKFSTKWSEYPKFLA